MTRGDVEVLMGEMEDFAAKLFELGKNAAGNALLDAIDKIDQSLEGVELE